MRNPEIEKLERQAETIRQEMRAIVSVDGPLSEDRRHQFDKARLQLESLNLDIEAAKRDYSHTPPPIDDPSGGRPFQKARSAARSRFENYILSGERERRDLTSVATPGQEFIPQEFYSVLTEAQKAWGGLVGIVRKVGVSTGRPTKVALSNDTSTVLHESGEPATVVETDPTLTSSIKAFDVFDTGLIKITLQELQDSAFDIDAFVRNQFGKRYFRGLTAKITAGSVSGNVEKLLNANIGYTTTEAGGTAIGYPDIVNLYSSLDPAYQARASWVMNAATRGLLLAVTDTLNRPLYVPSPTADSFDTLLGRPVILNQSAPNVGSAVVGPIQFGDFSEGYLVQEVQPAGVDFSGGGIGLAIVRLNERYMDTLEVGFIGYVRCTGKLMDAGTHPIQTLKMAT